MQNVATISSTQITPVEVPVVVPVEVPVVTPVEVPVVLRVTTCAAAGDVAKSSAVINASFFMCALVLRCPSPTWRCVLAAIEPERAHPDVGLRGHAALPQLAQPRRPITGSLLLAFALHFYSGQPLQNLSGVDMRTLHPILHMARTGRALPADTARAQFAAPLQHRTDNGDRCCEMVVSLFEI